MHDVREQCRRILHAQHKHHYAQQAVLCIHEQANETERKLDMMVDLQR